MTLPEKLMQLRSEQNLSQTALAEALGVSRQTVSKWEAGIAVPTTDNLFRLSKLYGTDLWTLTWRWAEEDETSSLAQLYQSWAALSQPS
mgnify:FL=1